MNLEKFTERSRGFLQAAQTIAMRESHQRLAPEHLLKALMDDDQGLASNLIRRAGGEPEVGAREQDVARVGGAAGRQQAQVARAGERERLQAQTARGGRDLGSGRHRGGQLQRAGLD